MDEFIKNLNGLIIAISEDVGLVWRQGNIPEKHFNIEAMSCKRSPTGLCSLIMFMYCCVLLMEGKVCFYLCWFNSECECCESVLVACRKARPIDHSLENTHLIFSWNAYPGFKESCWLGQQVWKIPSIIGLPLSLVLIK